MKTKIIIIKNKKDLEKINLASKYIKQGKLVSFPTETVYGLGANAFNPKAVKKIFSVKKRAQDNPLIVHIFSLKQLELLTEEISFKSKKLIEKFWPGPLTIVFKKKENVPFIVTAGLFTVAVRMPENKIALKLLKESNLPIVAPSANLSTKPSPTKAEHVINDFNNKIDCIIDGGKTNIGIESTVIDLTSKVPIILRPGKITKEEIEKIIGKVNILKNKKILNTKKLKSPGLKYKHYSPNAKVYLIDYKKDFIKNTKKLILENQKVSIFSLTKINFKRKEIIFSKKYKNIDDYAKNIFSDFREADLKYTDIIIIQGVKEEGFGFSLMNRLRKASFKII
jgi:L-threonylcarbamoyladenylate synthase